MGSWTAFRSVGDRIDAEWRAVSRDELGFPEIAHRALRDAEIEELDFGALVRGVVDETLPVQVNPSADFGQPPVTVYRGEGFFLELLFWVDALLSIHQHRFSGAFLVLDGSSIHSRYAFRAERRINSGLVLGRLSLEDASQLGPGDVEPILAGADLIHATYHLECPSVTLVARTWNELEKGPPYDYRAPGVAFDPSFERPLLRRRLALLDTVLRATPDDFEDAVAHLIAKQDIFGSYVVLDYVWARSPFERTRKRMAEIALERHGEVVATLVESLDELTRVRETTQLRGRTDDADLRFFLAILATVPDRKRILELVSARRPQTNAVEDVITMLTQSGRALSYDLIDTKEETVAAVRAHLSGSSLDAKQLAVVRRLARRGPLRSLLAD